MKHKSNCINISNIFTDLFLDPLCGEIDQVVNSKLCENINPNQSESSTSILKISNTNINDEKLTTNSQSIMMLPTVLASQSTTKTLLASEHQLYHIQTLPNYPRCMHSVNKLWRSYTYLDNTFHHYDMHPCEIEIDPELPPCS